MPKLSKTQKLTGKEAAFCLAYVMHFNATRAALAAGYSKKSAHYQGSEILARPRVRAELERLLAENGITAAEILARLSKHARGTFAHFVHVEADGSLRFDFSTDDAKDHMHLIKSIKTRHQRRIVGSGEEAQEWEMQSIEIELHDVQHALELLAKAYGLFRDININLNLNLRDLTNEQLEHFARGAPVKIIEYKADPQEIAKKTAALLPLPA